MVARKQVQPRLAKLSQPRLYNTVERERLFALLDAREQHPIIWVGGPAGAGKTTLVASYLATRKARTHWFQVDEGDKDPATLFHYLSEAAHYVSKKSSLPRYSADYADLGTFARHYFRELFRQMGCGAVLVLDNCQDAASESFHLALRLACEELPHHSNIIALSRSVLPGELGRLGANGLVKQIEWIDLRLTAAEAVAIGIAQGQTESAKLHGAYLVSDGWVTGLMLALAHSRTGIDDATAQMHTREALCNYFLREMLSRVSGDAHKVLTHCALFPQITVSVAEQISGNPNAGKVLNELYRNHYLIDRKLDVVLTYQFHDLFRDFLLKTLSDNVPAQELTQIRMRAATILESTGQVDEAVLLFQQCEAWDSIVRAIKRHAETLLDRGRWQTLNDWFKGIPEDVLCSDTWFTYWRGAALITVDLQKARPLLDSAYKSFSKENDDIGLLVVARTLVTTQFWAGEPLSKFREWLPALEAALARAVDVATPQILIDGWSAHVDIAVFGGCESALIQDVADSLVRAIDLPELSTTQKVNAAMELCCYAWAAADHGLDQHAASVLRKLADSTHVSPIYRHWAYQWIGISDMSMGNLPEAVHWLQKAIEIADNFNFAGVDYSANSLISTCLYLLGRTEEADNMLNIARGFIDPQYSYHWGIYHNALALKHYQRGELDQAAAYQKVCSQAFLSADSLGVLVYTWPSEAAYCAQSGRLEEALAVVEAVRSVTAKTIHRLADAALCFVLAEVARQREKRAQAIEHLREGLRHARNPTKASLLLSMTRCLPTLLALAIEEGLEPDAVRYVIKRWGVVPDPSVHDRWPWPVRIYALGQFRVVIDDESLPTKGKAHFKVIALLKAIIAAGSRQVSAQTLAEWLWPDSDGDTGLTNLKVAVHRLRKLLTHDDAVLFHDGKVSLNKKVCWLDVWSFDSTPVDTDQEKVLAIYQGQLLPLDDFHWLLLERERLHGKFLRASITAGKHYEVAKEFDAAVKLYEQCLAIDSSSESLYRQLMLCLKAAGRHSEALDAFQRCQRVLAASNATKPSRETVSVYESLLRV